MRPRDDLRGARILIVDDQEENVRLLERILRRAGYPTFATTTEPRLVLSLYHGFQPDILLLDLRMQALDGFEVLKQLRERIAPEACVPIVVMSADTSADVRRRVLSLGARDFLSKPLDLNEVQRLVEKLLEERVRYFEVRKATSESVGEGYQDVQSPPLPSRRSDDMGQLAREVAHDLSNLMSVIRNYAAFIRTAIDQQMASAIPAAWADIRRDAEEICVAAERSEALSARLLAAGYGEIPQGSSPR